MNVTFTQATDADADLLIELMREFYAIEHLVFDEQRARTSALQILHNRANGLVHLIYAEKQIIGYAVLTFGFSLEFGGRFGLLDELYLREEFRGRGLGKASLRWIETLCSSENIKAVRLEVDRANARAQQLYRTSGYRDDARDLLTKWLDK